MRHNPKKHYAFGDSGWDKYSRKIHRDLKKASINLGRRKDYDKVALSIAEMLLDKDLAVTALEEGQLLYGLSKRVDGIIVEIGTRRGGTTCIFGLSDRKNSSRVYSYDIDKYEIQDVMNEALSLKCNFITENSCTAGKNWTKGNVSLLFVDGDHAEDSVKNDLISWYPHLSPGSLIAFHDYPSRERLKRWKKRGNIKDNRVLGSSTFAGVHNAVAWFMEEHPGEFVKHNWVKNLFVIRKDK